MPLRLTLRPNERIIVNGCILKNGPRRHVLEVENRADVLRGDDMLEDATAQTPARRIAYHIQICLVSTQHRVEFTPRILADLDKLAGALPRFAPQIAEAEARVQAADFYAAFRALSDVIAHEDRLFAAVLSAAPPAAQP